ncbi:amidohydrolase [Pontibacter sp. JAM-7]|uniref:amidohydrolase n=1 Tax=Pontibacter sp. JAM-7 TaxID=3366581 RepID=UPI003AF5D780
MQDLTISLVQTHLHWQAPAQNRAMLSEHLLALTGTTDLIVLPEMFTSGFSMQPEAVAETMDGESVTWLRHQAKTTGAAICGSIVMKTTDGFRNRMLFVTPAGDCYHYDKRHLFRMGNEHKHYQSGSERTVLTYKGWRILPQVCYDLRFPVWSRNLNDYDLAIYVANWPNPRRTAWRTLLQARAIENQCYVAGVNRTGEDGNQYQFDGDSMLVNFRGETELDLANQPVQIASRTLSGSALQQFREAFPAWQDADTFRLD